MVVYLLTLARAIFWGESQRVFWCRALFLIIISLPVISLWWYYKERIEFQDCYSIEMSDIEIESIPSYVSKQFVEEAFKRRPLLEGEVLNILDAKTAQVLAMIFDAHPWVDHVESIRMEYPSHVVLKIKFREPIAFVSKSHVENALETSRIFLIDAEGYLLPSDYFMENPDLINQYMRIDGINSEPLTTNGTFWADPSVKESVRLAEFLQSDKNRLQLTTIVVEEGKDNAKNTYRLFTTERDEIIWGTFPYMGNTDKENDEESLSRKAKLKKEIFQKQEPKLSQLREMARKYGSLHSVPQNDKPINVSLNVK